MANVDVKLGIKHILDRIEHAYLKRNPVCIAYMYLFVIFAYVQSADTKIIVYFFFFRPYAQQSHHW